MQRIKTLFVCLLLTSVLAACAGSVAPPAHRAATPAARGYTPPTPAHVASPPAGDYTTTIMKRDGTYVIGAPAVVAPASVGSLSLGVWIISFGNDGYFTAGGPTSNTSSEYAGLGQYSVSGDLLTVSDVKCWEFNGPQAYTATYRWRFQGNALWLSPVGVELCSIRKILLTSHPLTVTHS